MYRNVPTTKTTTATTTIIHIRLIPLTKKHPLGMFEKYAVRSVF